MIILDVLIVVLLFVGLIFFFAGSIGLLRFPDLMCRVHALTKADNIGLACISLAVAIYSNDWLVGLKVIFVWLFILATSSLMSFIIARRINMSNKIISRDSRQ